MTDVDSLTGQRGRTSTPLAEGGKRRAPAPRVGALVGSVELPAGSGNLVPATTGHHVAHREETRQEKHRRLGLGHVDAPTGLVPVRDRLVVTAVPDGELGRAATGPADRVYAEPDVGVRQASDVVGEGGGLT